MKSLLTLILLVFSLNNFAQTDELRQKIKSTYDPIKSAALNKTFADYEKQQKIEIKKLIEEGYPERVYKSDGSFEFLVGRSSTGTPNYYSSDNAVEAQGVRASDLHTGGSLGLDINGEGLVAYVWDGGRVRLTHQEFLGTGKIVQADDATTPAGLNGNSFHATHVTGTMAANGYGAVAKGMAPGASIQAYMADNSLTEVGNAGFNGAIVSNHSYVLEKSNDNSEDWKWGAYTFYSYAYDAYTDNYEYYLPVFSAGNNGNNNTTNSMPLSGNVAFDKLIGSKCSKNGLVVANGSNPVFDANGDVTSFTRNSSSSEGPTDDLRVKPDIAGLGTGVFSCVDDADDLYNTFTGTSMAAPTVSGTLLLLQQYYHDLNAIVMKGATLKGLVLHTAVDHSSVGPDGQTGWGLLDAKAAANIITTNNSTSLITESNLSNGGTYTFQVTTDGTQPLTTSLSWSDIGNQTVQYDGSSGANNGVKALINDLDIRVTRNTATYYPWRLTSINTNANDGDNDRDPYERIDIENPASGTYTITVTHKGTLPVAGENFSIIVSGVSGTSLSVEENNFNSFSLYPNPTNNNVTVRFLNSNNDEVSIKLIDLQGRTIFTNKYESESSVFEKVISLSDLSNGMYFVHITQNDKAIVKQVLKK